MAVDPYAMCPCGSGKKLKFCCSDLVGEIEKIHRMIEGEQPRAALRHTEQTLATHPKRASLLDLKATLELSLGEIEGAKRTVAEFITAHPDSPTANACEAILLAELQEDRAAVGALQNALSLVDREMPLRVYEALGAVGGALLESGHVLGAQAHLWLHAALAPKEDTRSREVLAALNHYSGLPLLLRDQLRFRPWPEGVAWAAEADQASRLADNGKWRAAVDIIDRLGQKHGADPTLVYNRALLSGWLADDRQFVAGLHAYAQLDVPLDDAVEAEAVAQLLDPDLKEARIDSVVVVHEINNLDELVRKFLSDKRLQSFEMDPQAFARSDQPRPRNTFVLLDRPMPDTGDDLDRKDVPRLAAVVAIYGRQTDRPERVELTVDKGPAFATVTEALKEVAGDSIGDVLEERTIGSVSPTEQALNWRWQLPRGTSQAVRQRLVTDERRAAIVERWPELPQPVLNGKSPREAAGDPQLCVPLMAAVLILEQGTNTDRDTESIAELRNALNLPQPEAIEPAVQPMSALPLARVARLNLSAVTDTDLVLLYRRAVMVGAQGATLRLAEEAVRRPSLAQVIPPADAYQRMLAVERDPERALALVNAAREHSRAAGESTASWDLAELELHITSGRAEEAKELLTQIEREHRDDPQVAAALYQLLYETGVITDQMPAQPHSHARQPFQEIPAAAGAGAPEPGAGKIWTPGSDRPAGGKSALWTPS